MDELLVQSQDVANTAIKRMESGILDGPGDRFALFASSILVRMQFTRIVGGDNRKAFETEREALAWLLSE